MLRLALPAINEGDLDTMVQVVTARLARTFEVERVQRLAARRPGSPVCAASTCSPVRVGGTAPGG